MKWGLTEEQIKARAGGIGGSDAWTVCHGTPEERYELWQVKIGQKKPKKIMSDWNAAWRHVTEGLQLDWYEHTHPGHKVIQRGESCTYRIYGWMRCTLDGYIPAVRAPINAKHLSSWTKDARTWAIEHYTCQITHEATVVEADYGLISLIHGEKEPEIIEIQVDPFYQIEMLEREEAFWKCCVDRVPPEGCEELAVPKAAKLVPKRHDIDLNGGTWSADGRTLIPDPAWPNWAAEWIEHAGAFERTHDAHAAHMIARDAMKKLVPEDAGTIERGNVVCRQDGRGITIALKKEEK